jgi:hypothetical protein
MKFAQGQNKFPAQKAAGHFCTTLSQISAPSLRPSSAPIQPNSSTMKGALSANCVETTFFPMMFHAGLPCSSDGPKCRSTIAKPRWKYGPWRVRPTTANRAVRYGS